MALDDAERARRYRARRKEGVPAVRYRRPAERHTRPQRWAEAVRTLNELLDDYEQWRDSLPGVRHRTGRIARFAAQTGNMVRLPWLRAARPPCRAGV